MSSCLGSKCLAESSVVYYCKVTRLDTETSEFYTGFTHGPFKYRLYGHNSSFRHRRHRNQTRLSQHVWWLKDCNVKYNLEWKILDNARRIKYRPELKIQDDGYKYVYLCQFRIDLPELEKKYIQFRPQYATLNVRHSTERDLISEHKFVE